MIACRQSGNDFSFVCLGNFKIDTINWGATESGHGQKPSTLTQCRSLSWDFVMAFNFWLFCLADNSFWYIFSFFGLKMVLN